MRNVALAVAVVALGVGGSTACATKKYVNTQVTGVNDKVTTLSSAVEDNQERIRENATKIGEVDTRVGQVDQKATAAGRAADEAKSAASAVDAKTDKLGKEFDRATKRLVLELVLNESQGNFAFNKIALPDGAKSELDKMVANLTSDPKNVWIEIEGHTDGTGSEKYNESLGMQRAEAVKRYLYEAHQVPLHKMNVISYGEAKPVAPNNTRAGRAENRRIVIRVLG